MSYERATDPRAILRTVVGEVRDSPLTMLAAAIAYYGLVSLFPLLLLLLAVATTLGGEAIASTVVQQLSGVLSPTGQGLVRDALLAAQARGGATVVGLLGLLWGGLKLFRGLDLAFSTIYGTRERKSFLDQLRNAATALVAVGLAIGATVGVGVIAGSVGLEFVGTLGTLALVVVLAAAFLPLYYIFPDVGMQPREALPGAVFAAGGWTLLSIGFRIYAENAEGFALYGIVGAVLLLVTWFYFGGIVLLVGAVLNGVLSGDVGGRRDRQLQQGSLRGLGQRAMTEPGADDGDDAEPSRDDGQRDRDTGPAREASGDQQAADEPDDGSSVEGRAADRTDEERVAELREELAELESSIEERTVHREEIESDLKRYVRRRVRRGHARGWGPYLVLLYGTAMTLGAFYFLSGGWAILAMFVIWLSTLGMYVLMLLVGVTFNALGLPGRIADRIRDFRS